MFTPISILKICQAVDKFPEKRKNRIMSMNDRFKIPNDEPEQKLPKGDEAKCALAHNLLVKDILKQGIPPEVADIMATEVVLHILEDTKVMRKEALLRYSIYSTVYNN